MRRCRPPHALLPTRMPPLFLCFLFTRQSASAFNQPLSLDTSSITTMQNMFSVRSARALPAACKVEPSQHAACAAVATPRPPATGPACRPSFYASLSARQYASAFNQSLSFDTSSVTNMQNMFYVRSARALPAASTVEPSLPTACAAATPRPPVSRPRMPPSSYAFVLTRQMANGLSDANKLLIRCAWSGSAEFVNRYGSAWSGLGACSPPPPLPPLPPPPPPYPPGAAPRPPPPYAFTDTASLKTAAQEYNADVDSAIATYGPISSWGVSAVTNMNQLFYDLDQFNADISSWDTSGVTDMRYMFSVRSARALPAASTVGASLRAACAATATPRPPATRPARRPSSYASLSARQGASSFNQPLSFDTSSVTSMRFMFGVRSARALPATSIVGTSCTLLAPPLHPQVLLPTRTSPLFLCFPFDSAGRVGVQPAAEFQHVQRHHHVQDVSSAPRACPPASRHFPTPSCLPARISPSSYASLWTRQSASAFNQPLRFNTFSVTNMVSMFWVRSARVLPLLCSWALPCNCYPVARHLLPPDPHLATHRMPSV